jgi:hypothetical protein
LTGQAPIEDDGEAISQGPHQGFELTDQRRPGAVKIVADQIPKFWNLVQKIIPVDDEP